MTDFDEMMPYLKGEKFDNAKRFTYNFSDNPLAGREELIVDLIRGKKAIHVGCVDHVELLKQKIDEKTWLHGMMMDATTRCLGVDINCEGISLLKQEFKIDDLVCHDITSENKSAEIESDHWDYVVLGEVLEHIDNPVHFLSSIRKNYKGKIDRIIVSVPNAFKISNFKRVRKNAEEINTDHRYWFTPFTLAKILVDSGYKPEKLLMELNGKVRNRGIIHRMILRKYPLLRDGLMIIGSL
ncbi:MAG: methyltransferase domain-containing protein [Bacteroidota bacterium]